MKIAKYSLGILAAVLALFGSARASVIDLENNVVGVVTSTYGNAIFTGSFSRAAGTGNVDPFLSLQASPTEQGYNTSGGPVFDEKRVPQYTHNIQLQDLATTKIGSTDYYVFLIDINESNSAASSKISWDSLQFYTSPTGSQSTTNLSSLGVLRWDMDGGQNNTILYDDLNSGSGQGDLAFLIPTSAFLSGPNAALPTDYVYMYQAFGGYDALHNSESGFEETYIGIGITPYIPEISTVLPIALVLGGVLYFNTRRNHGRMLLAA